MIVGTTPKHTFTIPFDTKTIAKVRVLYSQNDVVKITKETPDCVLDGNTITVELSQEDTFTLDHSEAVEIQLRVVTAGNEVLASIPKKVGVTKCLDTVVI